MRYIWRKKKEGREGREKGENLKKKKKERDTKILKRRFELFYTSCVHSK